MVLASRAELAARAAELRNCDLLIEKLRHQLAGLRRQRFAATSEALDELELRLDDEEIARAAEVLPEPAATTENQPKRRPFPDHVPREERVLAPGERCADCGGRLKRLRDAGVPVQTDHAAANSAVPEGIARQRAEEALEVLGATHRIAKRRNRRVGHVDGTGRGNAAPGAPRKTAPSNGGAPLQPQTGSRVMNGLLNSTLSESWFAPLRDCLRPFLLKFSHNLATITNAQSSLGRAVMPQSSILTPYQARSFSVPPRYSSLRRRPSPKSAPSEKRQTMGLST